MLNYVVYDASCLIDLRKGGLLNVLGNLPYHFIIPLPIRESEVLDISKAQWQLLDKSGLTTYDLPPEQVGQALTIKKCYPSLSANDCFCIVSALAHSGILLTGDGLLRKVAAEYGLRVHGVLWVIDELNSTVSGTGSQLIRALQVWQSDNTVFLPLHEISTRLEYLSKSKFNADSNN